MLMVRLQRLKLFVSGYVDVVPHMHLVSHWLVLELPIYTLPRCYQASFQLKRVVNQHTNDAQML
jgi:hypothetical protein